MSLAHFHLPTPWLRRVLALDALAGAGAGLAHLLWADALAGWFGLSAGLISASGWALFAYAAWAGGLARQALPARGPLMLLILANLAWSLGCLVLAWGGGPVTGLGQAYLSALALAVLALAELEFLGWRAPALRLAA